MSRFDRHVRGMRLFPDDHPPIFPTPLMHIHVNEYDYCDAAGCNDGFLCKISDHTSQDSSRGVRNTALCGTTVNIFSKSIWLVPGAYYWWRFFVEVDVYPRKCFTHTT